MDTIQTLRSYAKQPITRQLLLSLFESYKRPNDKISELLHGGLITAIKRGLYVAGPTLNAGKPEPFLLANHILGPSYVSLDTALSYHGMIPERVYEISSMTVKAARKFNTAMGTFSYIHLPLPYYSLGIQQVRLADEQYAMVASPEKALADKIITTSGILLRSQKDAEDYLLDNLRMDEEALKTLDIKMMQGWLPSAFKKESLITVIKLIARL